MRIVNTAAALVAAALTACISPVPLTLNGTFSNPDTHTPGTPRVSRTSGPGNSCTLIVDAIADVRSDPMVLGSVASRPVRAPADVNAWLQSVVQGFESRGINVSFDSNPTGEVDPLVASLSLRLAWVSEIHTSKSATTLWHMRLRRGERQLADADYRGADVVMNWSSGDGELQRMVDRALGKSLDLMAADVRGACAARTVAKSN